MIFEKDAIGLDALIQRMQRFLVAGLAEIGVWGSTTDGVWTAADIDAYGRCYIVNQDGKKTVRNYLVSDSHALNGKNQEYRIISVPEKTKFFFLNRYASEKVNNLEYETKIEVIFLVDLPKIKPLVKHRADLEAQNDVENILKGFDSVWIKSLEPGFELAMNGLHYEQDSDLQPYHAFKFTLKVEYAMDDVCNCGCDESET